MTWRGLDGFRSTREMGGEGEGGCGTNQGGGGVEGWLTTDRLFSRRQRMPPPIISLPITGVGCMIFRLFLMVEA